MSVLSLSNVSSGFVHVVATVGLLSFPWLSDASMCGSAHALLGIWVSPPFWLLGIMLLDTLSVQVFVWTCVSSVITWMDT